MSENKKEIIKEDIFSWASTFFEKGENITIEGLDRFLDTTQNNDDFTYDEINDRALNYNILSYGCIRVMADKADPKPKDGTCEICVKLKNKKGITKLEHSNKDHSYNLPINPDEWWWIHESCHLKYDLEYNLRKKLCYEN